MRSTRSFIAALFLLLICSLPLAAQPIAVSVDATDAARKMLHTHLTIPAAPGPLTLRYPKWMPGEHGPTGPIVAMAGLRFQANGKLLEWTRDPLEMYAFHIVVPEGAKSVDVDFDFLQSTGGVFSSGESITPHLAVLSWNTVLLYPEGKSSDEIRMRPSLRLPAGWEWASALESRGSSGDRIDFEEVSLTTLIDSPVLAGSMLEKVKITDGPIAHEIDIASDSRAALETPADFAASYARLVAEAKALFGAQHYRHYNWLLTLSDHTEHFGLEHHESSDNRSRENALMTEKNRLGIAGLLAHEYAHSWNGKYRRPAGLATGNYDQPMQGELLWVYEGLTTYFGTILPPRSGLWTPEYFREELASTAAEMANAGGRSWRPLVDTAVEAQVLYGAPSGWSSYRRSVDFYPEGALLWLDADITIRQLTGGKRSLDDFCRAFFGGESGKPAVKPYTLDDVVTALNGVIAYDWRTFLDTRVRRLAAEPPLGGITNGGWKLVYTDQPNKSEERGEVPSYASSIGLAIDKEGAIRDVIPGKAAAKSGLAPGMKIVAVNERRFTNELLTQAIRETKTSKTPLRILVEDADFFRTYELDYHDGLRYPHLERDASKKDLLSEVAKPIAK